MCKRLVILGDPFDESQSDPSENTPLLTSSNASNYTAGLSPALNRDVGISDSPGLLPENTIQQSPGVSIENSVNHDVQPNCIQQSPGVSIENSLNHDAQPNPLRQSV